MRQRAHAEQPQSAKAGGIEDVFVFGDAAGARPFAERLAISNEVLARVDPLKIIGEKRWEQIPVEPWG